MREVAQLKSVNDWMSVRASRREYVQWHPPQGVGRLCFHHGRTWLVIDLYGDVASQNEQVEPPSHVAETH